MDKKFAIGVQVYLKSGGPDMTITKYPFTEDGETKVSKTSKNAKAECSWFDEDSNFHVHVFPIDALEFV